MFDSGVTCVRKNQLIEGESVTSNEYETNAVIFSSWQADVAKAASHHFPELPIAHPELGISEYLVTSVIFSITSHFICNQQWKLQ